MHGAVTERPHRWLELADRGAHAEYRWSGENRLRPGRSLHRRARARHRRHRAPQGPCARAQPGGALPAGDHPGRGRLGDRLRRRHGDREHARLQLLLRRAALHVHGRRHQELVRPPRLPRHRGRRERARDPVAAACRGGRAGARRAAQADRGARAAGRGGAGGGGAAPERRAEDGPAAGGVPRPALAAHRDPRLGRRAREPRAHARAGGPARPRRDDPRRGDAPRPRRRAAARPLAARGRRGRAASRAVARGRARRPGARGPRGRGGSRPARHRLRDAAGGGRRRPDRAGARQSPRERAPLLPVRLAGAAPGRARRHRAAHPRHRHGSRPARRAAGGAVPAVPPRRGRTRLRPRPRHRTRVRRGERRPALGAGRSGRRAPRPLASARRAPAAVHA